MKHKLGFERANAKIVLAIFPAVLLMILIFFLLTRYEIINLTRDKLELESKNYAADIYTWAEQVLNELDIYKSMVDHMGMHDEKTLEMLRTSADSHAAYPYGLYWGNESGDYFDSSGWVPGEDFVVKERDWYIEGLEHETFAFGEPYVDAMTGGTCVSASVRLKNEPETSVLSADVYLDYAAQLVSEITKNNIQYALYVTGDSRVVVADSNSLYVGKTLSDEDMPVLYRRINELLDSHEAGLCEVRGDNGIYYVDVTCIENTDWYFITAMSRRAVLHDLRELEVVMILVALLVAIVLNVNVRRIVKEMSSIRNKANTDNLTKLLNRDAFRAILTRAIETNPEQGVLVMLDLDNFKLINDQLGHPEGDKVLRRFAALMDKYFNRNMDIVARIGGDEFAVFVGREIQAAEARAMLNKFSTLFHETFDDAYPEQKLSVSMGCTFVDKGMDYHALYEKADKALYEAKRKGKNRFELF